MNSSTHRVGLRLIVASLFVATFGSFMVWPIACAPGSVGGEMETTIDSDMTLSSMDVANNHTIRVRNNAAITVNGDASVNGTILADNSRLLLRVNGRLTLRGALRAVHSQSPELDSSKPLNQQPVGLYIVVGDGNLVIDSSADLETNGNYVITDDEAVLAMAPQQLQDEVEDVVGDDLPTIAPLLPENPAFAENDGASKVRTSVTAQGGVPLAPVVVTGHWPPAGTPAPNGDAPIVVLRFRGPRDVTVRDWTVNGPAPTDRPSMDTTANGGDATARNGRRGLTLNMRNEGGKINIEGTVTLNLADGGRGGDAMSTCASATAGNGGAPGNLRISGSDGIDLSDGTLVINPGRGGDGGNATVTASAMGAAGCPGRTGATALAHAGDGARNEKALFVRGDVSGIENVRIGPVNGGNGGEARATGCDGADGEECCDGGAGGAATATGGNGGAASVDVKGLTVMTAVVTGGRGGHATANGGFGGFGGECKFDDGGDGGSGGMATATAGGGGAATNGAGASTGGNGGDANATSGDGGDGGDSGFGDPGIGGAGLTAIATAGSGGTTGGTAGAPTENDGLPGLNGGTLPTTVYCFSFANIPGPLGVIEPGTYQDTVRDLDGTAIGALDVDFVEALPQSYLKGEGGPDGMHIGISDGQLCVRISTLVFSQIEPGVIGGIRLLPLYGQGISASNPVVVEAMDADGNIIGTKELGDIPENLGESADQYVDAGFSVSESVAKFQIIVPRNAFLTLSRIYLLDP